jgi:hypothetical protein
MVSKISMTKKAFIKEHTKLPKILVHGTPAQRKKEANDQKKELLAVKKK